MYCDGFYNHIIDVNRTIISLPSYLLYGLDMDHLFIKMYIKSQLGKFGHELDRL